MTERAVLLIRRRRPIGESPDVVPGSVPRSGLLRGSAGAGRILRALSDLGLPVSNVTQSVHDIEATAADLAALDVGRLFTTVILGSHLVNTPDEGLRRAFLGAARRHLVGDGDGGDGGDGGDVLIEHHPIDWAESAEATQATPGAEVGMRDVRLDPPFVSAVSVYDVDGRIVRQPFKARVLSEAELSAEVATAGLRVRRRLSPTWLLCAAVGGRRSWPEEVDPAVGAPGEPLADDLRAAVSSPTPGIDANCYITLM